MVNATDSLNISAGVLKPSVLRGLSFNCLAIELSCSSQASRSAADCARLCCFVGGTPVHTNDGLRPIEGLRVQDLLLLQLEDGSSGADYGHMLRVVESGFQKIFALYLMIDDDLSKTETIFVTGAHLFGVREKWVRADRLTVGMTVNVANDSSAMVCSRRLVQASATADIGWVQNLAYGNEETEDGQFIDFTGATPRVIWAADNNPVPNDAAPLQGEDDGALLRKTYDLELADAVAYHVGVHGVRVRGAPLGSV